MVRIFTFIFGAIGGFLLHRIFSAELRCRCNAEIFIRENAAGDLIADPKLACVYFGGTVTWINETDEDIELVFDEKNGVRGPFRNREGEKRGSYRVPKRERNHTLEADRHPGARPQRWSYRRATKKGERPLDPDVMIKA